MTEELLDGSDIVAVLEQVGGERMAERVAGRPLRDAGPLDGVPHGPLEDGLVKVMAPTLAGNAFHVEPRG